MTNVELKEKIIEYSKEIGIDKIGFASADPFLTLKDRLLEQQRLQYQSGFEEKDIDKRVTPKKLLPEAKTIIAIALAYPSKMKNEPKNKKGERRGRFCRASWGEDYHRVLQNRLEKLEDYIMSLVPEAACKSMVDTGELSDRAVAERAGIGWSGKNCAIITPEFGSYVYLGEMITTLSLPPDTPITDQCGTCNKCVEACPTDALVQGGQLNSNKCIAYLTQTKDFLPKQYRKQIGNRLYGCDTCQQVCPENKGRDIHSNEEFEPDPDIVKPLLIPILQLSNREFRENYGPLAGSWRGKKPIQRNAIIALGNYKEESAIEVLEDLLLHDPRPIIRGSAAWALGQINTERSALSLYRAKETEKDSDIVKEINEALDYITSEVRYAK
ncbi:tRNA epoxyqueuosine(34) reductase QueG [Alteribacillus iranensis]|uniref:Epoxyqueuosine reductase n=1 Tax=Alteribacillus iranensis TaxID=930128 RepID=A0A1I2FKH9_9BACI|nr:tRNA epoxyqueuosine(34) reductase QueG [Alteribacillus iranensis]SFF05994.1 epoxyqueuosine reductase [Alteribacillus iranensis]